MATERSKKEPHRWKPGESGNPQGRPKAIRELLDAARTCVPAAFALAIRLMQDENEKGLTRLEAAKFLVSYGLGSPPKEPHPDAITRLSDEELERIVREHLGVEQRGGAARA